MSIRTTDIFNVRPFSGLATLTQITILRSPKKILIMLNIIVQINLIHSVNTVFNEQPI